MKGRRISTSLLIAIMASEKAALSINVPETKATISAHTAWWTKGMPTIAEIAARLTASKASNLS